MSRPLLFVDHQTVSWKLKSVKCNPSKKCMRGFTLIELMIGLVIGLLSTLAITKILLISEGQKRSTTSGAEAQANGLLALEYLREIIQMSGYGFANARSSIGCTLETQFNGAAVTNFPTKLEPVVIVDGAAGAPDSIRSLASSKTTYSIPISIFDPGYVTADGTKNKSFPVIASFGVADKDLLVAVIDSTRKCQVFQSTGTPTSDAIPRDDDPSHWNPPGYPDQNYGYGQYLINLGAFDDTTLTISAQGGLQFNKFILTNNTTPSYTGETELFANIVNMQAYYGKDIDGNGVVDTWDTATPTTNAGWLEVTALRIALVSRSNQYEKDVVTAAAPMWDVGANSEIADAITCGTSKCVSLVVPHPNNSTDWQHYRYKVFDTMIPLQNMVWRQ